jgi:GH15 family glucan-1,4-alpha-glucosidase
VADCHAGALVSRTGSVEWCCMPRLDSGSVFGRLLDRERGGYCRIAPREEARISRRYLDNTLVLETTFVTGSGQARLLDCFTMRRGGRERPHRQLLRVVEGVRGRVDLEIRVAPRFNFGEALPWVRGHGDRVFTAIGGSEALVICGDLDLEADGKHDLAATASVGKGRRLRLSLAFDQPEDVDPKPPDVPDLRELDRRLDETVQWWRRWAGSGRATGPHAHAALRSAIVLKGLTQARTGAIAAAATSSLPEVLGGRRNWDYRLSWVRDSTWAVRSLAELGYEAEADGFRRFVERSSAGHAVELQVVFGLGGERLLTEVELDWLDGYRGSRPVRAGNEAATQRQNDAYGELLEQAWRWQGRGHIHDDEYWEFLVELVEGAAERWSEPDRGIWESREGPRHFVHSKVMCWAALDRGLRLAEASGRKVPRERWEKVRDEIRTAVETQGYDQERGVFVRIFGERELDGALLLLPQVDFVDWKDDRMVRTADAIRQDLEREGLLYRTPPEGGRDQEGAFLPCSFWLAECLAHQGRTREASEVFERASQTMNDVGLFAEEFDPQTGEMLGNFPQALTHLSHISAALALGPQA